MKSLKRIFFALFAVFGAIAGVGLVMTFHEPGNLWIKTHEFAGCPSRPSCVSSKSDDDAHRIAPLHFAGDLAAARKGLEDAIRAMPLTTIVHATPEYLHVVFETPKMRFHDDVELLLEPGGTIHVRSLSRFGYRDMGINRERVELLREATARL